jgi:hypothetical protein
VVEIPEVVAAQSAKGEPSGPALTDDAARNRLWIWFNVLSLDAPLVAMVWQWLFARCYGVALRWPGFVSLALSVWLIYIADRLLDLKETMTPATARHTFTRRHRRQLSLAALAALPLLLWGCLHLSSVVLRNGAWMTVGVMVYFLAVHAAPPKLRRLWPKELAVGVIFALGTSLVVWSRTTVDRRELLEPTLLFAALCWLNCVAIEHWEWRVRVKYRLPETPQVKLQQLVCDDIEPHGLTRWVGRHLTQSAAAIALASFLLLPSASSRPVMIAAVLSAGGLLWLESRSRALSLDALRVLADAVLLSPTLLLLYPR